jgi:hypothetical protein
MVAMDPTTPMPGYYAEPPIVQIGEINVTSTAVNTPAGQIPLRGSQWTVVDQWQVTERTPQWAIICAIVGFCFIFLFSLLFLLAKEQVYTGTVTVTVSNGAAAYVARIPVANQAQVQHVYNQVNYIRSLALI